MLLKRETLQGIAAGKITLAFRRWQRPTVKAGGELRTAIGMLAIESIDPIAEDAITEADADRAGYATRALLLKDLAGRAGTLYRIVLRRKGADPRVALRQRSALRPDERDFLLKRLAKLDAAARRGPWVAQVLGLIAEQPAVRAGDLAASLGRAHMSFKADVRKLKNLGLIQSLEIGYRLSPRGHTTLALLNTANANRVMR